MPPEILEGLTATRIHVSFRKSIALSWRISADRYKFDFIGNFNFTIDFISRLQREREKDTVRERKAEVGAIKVFGCQKVSA